MNTPDNDKQIAYHLYAAQICSDAGKGIHEIDSLTRNGVFVASEGYRYKDQHIAKAISLILKSKSSAFRFYVKSLSESRNYYLVYFDWRPEKCTKYQISFHSFSNWKRYTNKKYSCRWDKGNSRLTAEILGRTYGFIKGGDAI